jgi:nitrogenase molybdenum-iron protein NifN
MAALLPSSKACAENPLKSSAPLGAALAYLGVKGSMPLFHGSQGCTAFALVLAVRHFKEAIPLQTTAMDEPATVLGGAENLGQALVNIQSRAKPRVIGIASTALVETRGEDFRGELKTLLGERSELEGTKVVFASTPDFDGALEEGWARGVTALIDGLVPRERLAAVQSNQLNLLPGVHETTASIEEFSAMAAEFGFRVRVVPDLATALDGHVPESYVGTSLGGVAVEEIERMSDALCTIALGAHMREPARILEERTGVRSVVLPTWLGLGPADELVRLLGELSGRPVSERLRRERSRLVDAMLDGHFSLSGRRVAIGADPDLLSSLAQFLHSLGAEIRVAISSTKAVADPESIPCETVYVGDLGDLEARAKEARVEMIFSHSHGRQAAAALGVPLFRIGFPIFDRLGHTHRSLGGYRGTRQLIFEIANTWLAEHHEPGPSDFAAPGALPIVEGTSHGH